MQPTLDFIKQIALDAGKILQDMVGGELGIQHKSEKDLVTRADKVSEDFIIGSIQEAFTGHTINAEESGHLSGTAEHQWFIDPIDGTLNYAHGVPFYCVSIAYAYQGEVTLGVVYDPVRQECFSAELGEGAHLNGEPIHVASYNKLVDCMLSTGFPGNRWGAPDDNLHDFYHFSLAAQTVRRLGSAALDLTYVAAGRLDGFWEKSVHNWDIAAAGLIVKEAGGVVTNVFGGSDYLTEPISIAAGNPVIHPQILEVLAQVRREYC